MSGAAILLVGDDTNSFAGHRVYANDLALWMHVLHRRFDVEQARMIPLYANGGTIETTEPAGAFEAGPATREHLVGAFTRLASLLNADDPFFFVVSNHGTRPPDDPGILLSPRRAILTPQELTIQADRLRSRRQFLVLGQCGAARFGSLAGPGRAVLAGCREHQGTYVRKDDDRGRTYQWTEFLFNLAFAIWGDADEPPPSPSLRAAFDVAEQSSTHRKLDEDGEWPILFDPDDISGALRVCT